jgi:aminoglycoside phosphotransferase (APT) family kinase protein
LTREEAFALEGLLPATTGALSCASPVPDSLQHDDLHSNNACWPGEADDLSSVRIIDWGDASVGHPFETMLATLNSIAFHAGALREDRGMDDPRVPRIRDAYMEPFAAWAAVQTTALGGAGPKYRDSALTWESALQEARRQVPGTRLAPGATKALGGREVARQRQHHQADRSSYGHAASASVSRGWLT